jgi:hypothetical protein
VGAASALAAAEFLSQSTQLFLEIGDDHGWAVGGRPTAGFADLQRSLTRAWAARASRGAPLAFPLGMRDVVKENREKLLRGLAAGGVATAVMSGLMLLAPHLAGVPDVAAHEWASLTARPLVAVVALLLHFGYGGLAGALYAAGAERPSIASGLFFGLALWGIAVAVYAPLFGLGFIASHQPALAAIILPLHLVYGMTLGALGPRGEIVQPIHDRYPLTFADA